MRILFLLFCIAVLVFDVLWRRVPNLLLILAIAIHIGLMLATGSGLDGLTPMRSITGFAAAFAVFFPLYMLRVMGAGDVKLFAVLGLMLGGAPLIEVWLIGSLLAFVHALCVLAVRKYPPIWLLHAGAWIEESSWYRRLRELRGARSGIPYAGYLAVGAVPIVFDL